MKKILAWIGVVLFAVSCSTSETEVFSESKTFPGNTWQRFSKLNFRVPVDKLDKTYNFFFILDYDSLFNYDHLPLHAILNTPGGEERIYTFEIEVRDSLGVEKGSWVAEEGCYRLRSALWQGMRLNEEGAVRLSLEQLIPKLNTAGIHRAGVEVTVTKNQN